MNENRLVSMCNYITVEEGRDCDFEDSYYNMIQYKNFLNQPLNIGQFVPAFFDGGKWVVLEVPSCEGQVKFSDPNSPENKAIDKRYKDSKEQYQQAKDNVIFEGFEVVQTNRAMYNALTFNSCELIFHTEMGLFFKDNQTIQDLIKYKPTLTKYGQQQAGL